MNGAMNEIGLHRVARLVRLPAGFTAVSNIVAAYTITTDRFQWDVLGNLILVSLCLYYAGMVLNDVFDYERDQAEGNPRPLVQGLLSWSFARTLGCVLMALGLLAATALPWHCTLIAFVLALSIIFYNRGGRQGWLPAATMGWCRYLNWLMALAVSAPFIESWYWPLPVWLYITALTRLSQDESAGKNQATLKPVLACLMLLLVLLWGFSIVQDNQWALLLVTLFITVLCYRAWRLYVHYNADDVRKLVGFFIFMVIPLDALLLFSAGHILAAVLLLGLIIPAKWTGRWMAVT